MNMADFVDIFKQFFNKFRILMLKSAIRFFIGLVLTMILFSILAVFEASEILFVVVGSAIASFYIYFFLKASIRLFIYEDDYKFAGKIREFIEFWEKRRRWKIY